MLRIEGVFSKIGNEEKIKRLIINY